MADIVFTVPSVLNSGGGEKKTGISAGSLPEAFARIAEAMGDDFRRRVLEADGTPRSLINVYVNGKNAKFSGGMDIKLKDGDEVYILPAVAGGGGDGGEEKKAEDGKEEGGSRDLSSRELDRFSRQIMLEEIGYGGQLRLKNSRVCVVGTGGLGNPVTVRLAAMGAGMLRIVDRDVIELSNLHRQTLFDEDDVGSVKVEAASRKLRKLNPGCRIEALAVSVNEYTAPDVVRGCDVVIDALDSVDARYALNKACVGSGIPFVTGAAVGVTGQAFTVVPGQSACYNCVFPGLDEDSMPTCSIEGVHPSILSIVGGIEVAEAVKVILGKKPSLSGRILHVDLENMDFTSTRTLRAEECPVCGSGTPSPETGAPREKLILEELCGRGRGRRTFSITPTATFDLDVPRVTSAAQALGLAVDNRGDLGLSMRNDGCSVSFMKSGSAIVVCAGDGQEAVRLYNSLLDG